MEIKTLEVSGFASALEAVHLPYTSEVKSKEVFVSNVRRSEGENEIVTACECNIHPEDMFLLKRLRTNGDEHAKVLRGIMVYAKITAPIYWWWDLETYVVGHQRLCSASTMNEECKGLRGEAAQKAKAEIPFGREITKVDCFSYQTLTRIYAQRYNHRLPEFRQFCEWIERLPFFEELIRPIDHKAIHLEQFINKACKWLTDNHTNLDYINTDGDLFDIALVEDFRTYMKGGKNVSR